MMGARADIISQGMHLWAYARATMLILNIDLMGLQSLFLPLPCRLSITTS
jgi:hypothetical protein